ncbi:MAG: YMGG-like glycine zipper-containing protein [Pyrinomonadaceae bacterium]
MRDPAQYDGAVIEGYISGLKSSGRVTGRSQMTLNFERIRLRNGRTYKFAGLVENVRTPSGENVKVDNEGAVQQGDSQSERTVERAAIGSAIGAVIGAIAGGGKGAAIGAVIGGGAGAGSVYAQGRDELDLLSGSELTIRASAPR